MESIQLSPDELKILLNTIGIAFKTGSLSLGDAFLLVPIATKIQRALPQESTPATDDQTKN